MTCEAVIFDCDGVLIDSETIATVILAADLAEVGLPMAPEEAHRRFTGWTTVQIAEVVKAETGRPVPGDWVQRHVALVREVVTREVEAIPGVLGVLDVLDAAGIPWGVASQSGPLYLEQALGRVGIWQRAPGRVVSAQLVGKPKPAPDVYLKAMEQVGARPETTVVIEDSPTGIRAGVAAGARVIGFALHQPPTTLLAAGAATTFDDMTQLPALLGLT